MAAAEGTPAALLAALVSPEGRADPYPWYERLRAHGSLVTVKPGLMLAVGYAECDRALRETRLRVQDAASLDREHPGWREHPSLRAYADSMLYRNPPDHARMRRMVSGAFTPRRVSALRPAVAELTDRLLDQLADAGADGSPVEFIAGFASRLPIAVISRLLGVPEQHHSWFRTIAADVTLALEGIDVARLSSADAAMTELAGYFAELIAHRRRMPADDLVSALVRADQTEADQLTHDELIGNLMLMLTAGFETTSFLLGHGLRLALRQPRIADRLRAEPELAPGYVEETLRFEPPVQATSRWSTTDVDILGTRIPAGTKLVTILAAGNRDPRRFHRPLTFDPDRVDIQPLSFGAGGHFCLGAPLARMEGQIALPRLLRRFPALAIAGTPVQRDTWVGRGFDRLPVTLR